MTAGYLGDGLGDPATPRHLRSGLFIHDTHTIPHSDWLGFYDPPLPWIDFEWGFECLLITLYGFGKVPALVAYLYIVYGMALLTVHRTLVIRGYSFPICSLVTIFVGLTLLLHFSVRPPMITYWFLAVIVEVWRNRGESPLIRDFLFLPIMFMAWTWLHGGWIAAFLFWGLSFTGRGIDGFLSKKGLQWKRLLPWFYMITICFLATFLNPCGIFLHEQLIHMAVALKSAAMWDEYHVPNFAGPSLSACILLFYMFVTIGTRMLKEAPAWSAEEGLPLLVFTYFAFKAQRHGMLLAVIAAAPLARDLEFVLRRYILKGFKELEEWLDEIQATQRTAGADAWLCVVAILVAYPIFAGSEFATNIKDVGSFRVPSAVVDFVKTHLDHMRRPLTSTGNAGPLLWLVRPNFRDSFDDRGDLYGDPQVFAFIHLQTTAKGWLEILKAGHYDSAIMETDFPLAHVLDRVPGWTIVYPSKEVRTKLEGADNPFVNPYLDESSTQSTTAANAPLALVNSPNPTSTHSAPPANLTDEGRLYIFFYDPVIESHVTANTTPRVTQPAN